MIGLQSGKVILCEHQKDWEIEANKTITILKSILGPVIKDIQHVGSTSISTIKAKPIIDIAIEVDDLKSVFKYENELKKNGFYYRQKNDLKDQILFACGSHYDGTGDLQTHYIHIYQTNSRSWIDTINFRDYLRRNISAAKKYENLKISLSQKFSNCPNRDEYIKGKNEFIKSVCRRSFSSSFLGKKIDIIIDRPIGSVHPKFNDIVYNVNYGYIPNVFSDDGEEFDVYLMGVDHPVEKYSNAHVIAIIYRLNDNEDKIVAAPDGIFFSKDEIEATVNFQEKYFENEIEILKSST